MKPTGFVIYSGPSKYDGTPIVAIALTGQSENSKTGAMVQTYILRSDWHPIDAVRAGEDAGICGDCKHRGDRGQGRTCYVNLAHGPSGVWAAYRRGRYPVARDIASLGIGRMVRLGTYGDPAMVPVKVWLELVSLASGWTGYTHQWAKRPDLAGLCMASCDNVAEFSRARAMGFRAFIVRTPSAPLPTGAISCPASRESGYRTQCVDCGLCNGSKGPQDRRKHISIMAHGATARAFTGE